MSNKKSGLQQAIDHAGGLPAFAKKNGVRHLQVATWLSADAKKDRAKSPVDLAVEKAGGWAQFAASLGVTRQAVGQWLVKGYVPLARAKEIEMQYGIPRNDLVSAKVRSNLGLGGDL